MHRVSKSKIVAQTSKFTDAATTERNEDYANAPGPKFIAHDWFRAQLVDVITLTIVGLIGIGIYLLPPAPNRSFPLFFENGQIVYPEFAYPKREEIVPIWLAALLSVSVPTIFFALLEIRRKNLDIFLTTTTGLFKSLVTAATFQVFLKWLIGGLRPHFYAVCKPNISIGPNYRTVTNSGNGFANIMYDRSVCTGDTKQINDSLESFPSGHSTAAFAGFVYLALYLNAQLKVMSDHNPAYWKMLVFFAPLLWATLIAGALTIDEFHNWYDVVAGGIIGSCTAFVAFRQTFAAIFDFRRNHLLLPRVPGEMSNKPS